MSILARRRWIGSLRSARAVRVTNRLPLLICALAACSPGAKHDEPKHDGPLLYVSDEASGTVVVVDPATATVTSRIPVGKRPRGVKLSRDGKLLYVALSGSPRGGPGVDESKLPPGDRSADGIGVVDLATKKLIKTLESGQDPETFDLSPDGKTLFISNEETAEMSALDLVSGSIRGRAKVGVEPEGVGVRPDGKVVFVTSEADGDVTAVDTQTLAVLAHMKTGPRPRGIVFTHDSSTAFVTNENGSNLTVLDALALKTIGEVKIHLDSPMPLGARPMGCVLSPDGTKLYVTTGRGGSLAIVDVATRAQLRSIDGVGDRPWGVAVSRDGSLVYTANGSSHDLSIVNLHTGNVDRRVAVGGLPWGVVLAP
jgi:YVTN family beta-propeller protein